MGSTTRADQVDSGFVIDEVPGTGPNPKYTWTLLDRRGETLARAPRAYPSVQEAQVAIAETQLYAADADIPQTGDALIG